MANNRRMSAADFANQESSSATYTKKLNMNSKLNDIYGGFQDGNPLDILDRTKEVSAEEKGTESNLEAATVNENVEEKTNVEVKEKAEEKKAEKLEKGKSASPQGKNKAQYKKNREELEKLFSEGEIKVCSFRLNENISSLLSLCKSSRTCPTSINGIVTEALIRYFAEDDIYNQEWFQYVIQLVKSFSKKDEE